MPIRAEFRALYPPDWQALSARVRFERARGRCQRCGRAHGSVVRTLADGRWFDAERGTWRDGRGFEAPWPDVVDYAGVRTTRVVLAACHRDHDPGNNSAANLRAWCQRCHLASDRLHHRRQRRLSLLMRRALGDLFGGPYDRRRPPQFLHGP